MDVLSLLRSKNRCLERFLEISRDFLAAGATLETLDGFEERRESTLKAIELYDRKIAEAVSMIPPQDRNLQNELIARVRDQLELEMNHKEKLIHEILDVDLQIIGQIEQLKNRLLQDVAAARQGKQSLAKFKSTWIPESGEGLDEIL